MPFRCGIIEQNSFNAVNLQLNSVVRATALSKSVVFCRISALSVQCSQVEWSVDDFNLFWKFTLLWLHYCLVILIVQFKQDWKLCQEGTHVKHLKRLHLCFPVHNNLYSTEIELYEHPKLEPGEKERMFDVTNFNIA